MTVSGFTVFQFGLFPCCVDDGWQYLFYALFGLFFVSVVVNIIAVVCCALLFGKKILNMVFNMIITI